MTQENTTENHYVDDKEFYEEMKVYIADVRKAESNDEPLPKIPDCIGAKILLIATNLSYRYNFINYPFREDLVGDAIENTIRYIKNFNPDKYTKPYSYVNRICWQAMVRRILKEKKLLKTKMKYIQNLSVDAVFSDTQEHDGDDSFDNQYIEFLQEVYLKDIEEELDTDKVEKAIKQKERDNSLKDFIEE